MTEYERLTAFTRLLHDTSEMLRLKGRELAADVLHDEAVHFARERDIARAIDHLADDLGELSGD
ncbi:hypothetical protein [Mycolicibacterium llatzerense]|uniref:hypothetical protein n=1 Tax=Mycolicibacterium llatzerense TaxID=280871 RepID=UPI0021B6490E|nr:hypothetical protein [Mycolicibacterium llatzerense]MCT7369331.1 hypothetical protein [Mycolicibacterium llatzerense]